MPRFRLAKRPPVVLEPFLPPVGWKRWTAHNKAAVVVAIRSGILTRADAYERYMLSEEELSGWEEAFDLDGIAGLQAKHR